MISVLYVDDWLPLLDTIGRILEKKEDIVVETSYSIEAALRKLDYLSFDVIITDYNSKESRGIDLLRADPTEGIYYPLYFLHTGAKPRHRTGSRQVWQGCVCPETAQLQFEL